VTFLQAQRSLPLHAAPIRSGSGRNGTGSCNRSRGLQINALLVQSGMEMPPDGCFDRRFNNMVFEQIYAILEKERQPEPEEKASAMASPPIQDGSGNEPGDEEERRRCSQPYSEPKPTSLARTSPVHRGQGDEAMQRILKQEWEQKIAQAVAIAKAQGSLPQDREAGGDIINQRLPGRRSSAICCRRGEERLRLHAP